MNNPLIYLLRKMWQYSAGNRGNVVLYVSLFVVANIVGALEPLIIGKFFNAVQTEGVSRETLPHLFLLLALLPLQDIIFWCLHSPARVIEEKNAFMVRANYKKHLLDGVMNLPTGWHTDHHSGDTIDKIQKGTDSLFHFSSATHSIFRSIILLLMAFGALLFYSPVSGGVVIVLTILTFYVLLRFDRVLVPGYIRVNRMENVTSAKVFDTLSNITTVIILRVEQLVLKAIEASIQEPFNQHQKNSKVNELKWASASLFGYAMIFIVIGSYLLSHLSAGEVLIGTIYILYGYTQQIQNTFFNFASVYNDIVRQRTSVANAEEIAEDFRENFHAGEKRLPYGWKTLSLEHLSFSYHSDATPDGGADLHIDDLHMHIRKGERIALIGASGGGKSTLLKLMRELYHPKTLALSVDDEHVVGGFTSISDSISLIPEDPEIFATTIRENITLGVDYTDEHIKIFTDMASFTGVVNRLPRGIESSIVEKGVNLSGGEKQRLALARGLLASTDKDIVLLDEPTSSVDFRNELKIYENIFSAFPGKTIISSIHRLHLLSRFDTVYFLRDGKVIARGSFAELKNSSPEFQELWERYIHTRDARE